MALSAAIVGVVSTLITALFGLFGAALKTMHDNKQQRTADWSSFVESSREWTEARLEERDRAIHDLQVSVSDLRKKVESVTGKYNLSLRYIITLWGGGNAPFLDPPDEIESDLPTPPWHRLSGSSDNT